MHVNEGTLARSLLSSAIDDLDTDPANVASLLDGIDGALERAQLGAEQAAAGPLYDRVVMGSSRRVVDVPVREVPR